jgi:hypothetical protein
MILWSTSSIRKRVSLLGVLAASVWLLTGTYTYGQAATAPAASTATAKKTIQGAQERLLALGYQPGAADGVMGAKAIAALKKFQSDHSLPVTGQLDRKTLDALNAMPAEVATEPAEVTTEPKTNGADTTRFVDHGDGTISDKQTGLMWTKDSTPTIPGSAQCSTNKEVRNAVAFVNCLNQKKLAGHSDWRMPSILELASLCNKTGDVSWLNPGDPMGNCNHDRIDMTSWLTQQGFNNFPVSGATSGADSFLSSSKSSGPLFPGGPTVVWSIDMHEGIVSGSANSGMYGAAGYVWPVRARKK